MIGFYNYTIVPTYFSMASAICGICLCIFGQPVPATYCLLLSGIIDLFDGKIARTKKDRTEEEKMFGIQIDSLCDLVAFGVLPVTIGYTAVRDAVAAMNWSPKFVLWFLPLFCLFTLAAVTRLGYFNVTEEIRHQANPNEHRKQYEGLPVTFAALIFPGLYSLRVFPIPTAVFGFAYAGALLLVAWLFCAKCVKLTRPGAFKTGFMICLGLLELTLLVLLGVKTF